MTKRMLALFITASAIIYALILYYMLFRGFGRTNIRLSEDMWYNYSYNLVPFKTIIEYIADVIYGRLRGRAIRNLAGNLLLLFPLGFYLPFFSRRMARVGSYMLFVAALIAVIEIMQVVTRTGSGDVDDFILNFAGAMIGFYMCEKARKAIGK